MMPNTPTPLGERLAATERTLAELLDDDALAKMLNASPRHIRRLSDSGRMPAPVRLGALVRWQRTAILAWIEGGCLPVRQIRGGAHK